MNLSKKQTHSIYIWLFMSLVILLIVCVAFPTRFYFLNDDFIHIPKAAAGILGHNNSIRYIGDLSLYLDSLWSGNSPIGYHITNLLLHIANVLLIVPLLLQISTSFQITFRLKTAVLIAALFGVYAFHSDAIFWIIGRTASLSLFFNLLCWLCFFKALKNRAWLLPMSLLFLAGIFSYEAVWVFPFWLLAWYFLLPPNSTQYRKTILPIAMIWGLFILYFPVRLMATGEVLGSYEAQDVQQLRLLPVIQKTFALFARSFLPPVYGHKWFLLFFVEVFLLLAALCRWLWLHEKSNRLLWFFAIAWMLSYFPYISLGVSTTGYQSERYLYFPSLFLSAFLLYSFLLIGIKNQSLSYSLMSGLLAYHFFFFIKAAQDFKTINRYANEGMTAIKSAPVQKQLVIKNLPAFSYGFPIFDYGFTEAIQWMTPVRNSGSVIVLNKVDFRKAEIQNIVIRGTTTDTLIFYNR